MYNIMLWPILILLLCIQSQQTSYIKYDYEWKTSGNVSAVQSNQCPPSINKTICISDSYNWFWDDQYHLIVSDGSIYQGGTHSNKYLYNVTGSGNKRIYYLKDTQSNTNIETQCITDNASDIFDCNGNWQHFYDDGWIMDKNMISTHCQNVCMYNKDNKFEWVQYSLNEYVPHYIEFEWVQYNITRRSNIYKCRGCENNIYLYGWINQLNGEYKWKIGTNPNESGPSMSECKLGVNLNNKYTFNLPDCPYWKTDEKKDIIIFTNCHKCIQLQPMSTIYRSYLINDIYENFAVGFNTNNDEFIMEYRCNTGSVDRIIGKDIDSSSMSFLYKLAPETCDNASSISVEFIANNKTIYINDIYLYYIQDNMIYFDDMTQNDWITTSTSAISRYYLNEYCHNGCYKLAVTQNDRVFIRKTISLNLNKYSYFDVSIYLEWSLQTNVFRDNTTLNVAIQCNNNYSFNKKLYVLKQYIKGNHCTNHLCNIQAYKIPSLCNLATTLTVQFELYSSTTTTAVVYIEYIKLTQAQPKTLPKTSTQTVTSKTERKRLSRWLLSGEPTTDPTTDPTDFPTWNPTDLPTTEEPTATPTTANPTATPIISPTNTPTTAIPSSHPTFDSISCGETRTAYRADGEKIIFVYTVTEPHNLVYLESCNTDHDTTISIEDSTGTLLVRAFDDHQHGDQTRCNHKLAEDVTIPFPVLSNQQYRFIITDNSGYYSVTLFCFGSPTVKPSQSPLAYNQTHSPIPSPTQQAIPSIACNETQAGFRFPNQIIQYRYIADIAYSSVQLTSCGDVGDGEEPESVLEIKGTNDMVIMTAIFSESCDEGIKIPHPVSIGDEYTFILKGEVSHFGPGSSYGNYLITLNCSGVLETSLPTTSIPTTLEPSRSPLPNGETHFPTENPTIPTIAPTGISQCDRLNTLSNWKSKGDVSITSSNNCPSMTSFGSQFENKICISNSYNSLWDGQYEWQYHDKNVDGSIYYNYDKNTYLHQWIEGQNYKYFLNNYQQDTDAIFMTQCNSTNIKITNIRDCIGIWKHFYDNSWHLDTNMITTTCNDICVRSSKDLYYKIGISNGNRFVWSGFNIYRINNKTVRSDIYKCKDCIEYYSINKQGVFIYGYIDSKAQYKWAMNDLYQYDGYEYPNSYFYCKININSIPSNYLFDVNDCLNKSWHVPGDVDVFVEQCDQTPNYALKTLSSLPIFQESQICVENSNNSRFNGIYKWLYYDSIVKASIYYNVDNYMYITPYMNKTGNYQYHISGYQENTTIHAKCSDVEDVSNIAQCIGKWKIYDDHTWNIDTNMVTTPCQEICVSGHILERFNGIYEYSHYDIAPGSNVYKCRDCGTPGVGYNIYACSVSNNGWFPNSKGTDYWIIGDYLDNGCTEKAGRAPASVCEVNCNNDTGYIFNIEDCFYPDAESMNCERYGDEDYYGDWYFYDYDSNYDSDNYDFWNYGYNYIAYNLGSWSWNLGLTKCSAETVENCIEMKLNSDVSRIYPLNQAVKQLAIGFDVNVAEFDILDVFMVKYNCKASDDQFEELIKFDLFDYQIDSSLMNIIYNIPYESCKDASSVSITFISEISSTSNISVYIDNICLYSNINQQIFYDEMNSKSNWITESQTVLTGFNSNTYCKSDGNCYILFVSSETMNHVSITKTISLSDTGYNYMDLNLVWSLITSGLSDDTILDVKIQCSTNLFYVFDLCTIEQYNSDTDCVDISCAVRSYNLPLECDLSSKIMIQFYLQSTSPTDKVYIDYVSLTHSDTSGNPSPLCRTSSPTGSPTPAPTKRTDSPSLTPTTAVPTTVDPFSLRTYNRWEYILLATAVILLFLCILITSIWCCVNKHLINKYKKEMAIQNAMVILLAIGEYDETPKKT